MTMMAVGIGCLKLVAIGIWLLCSSRAIRTTTAEDVYPLCSVEKVSTGDPLAIAIEHLMWNLVEAGPKLASNPGAISCYDQHDHGPNGDAWAYGSVACTVKDAAACNACLAYAIHTVSDGCLDCRGAQVALPECFLRYEAYRYCD
ncbi:unnamed protein product [Linum trigynum]|uniref:Gnk2-homologous domain-containing protein n=1 Tax=Linum trigynum TaxID=586398 RepID=A0AAV2EHK0_9ROSI